MLRFYIVYRALVRAKICAIRAAQSALRNQQESCRSYLDLAGESLALRRPSLVITHGLPGCGKTLVSQALLEKLLAIRLRSDVERKRLFGLRADQSSRANMFAGIYGADATSRTYRLLLQTARQLLGFGFPVIVDAAFLRQQERAHFMALAAELRVPFVILSVEAAIPILRQRVAKRQRHGRDASEAGLDVLDALQAVAEPLLRDELAHAVEFRNEGTPADIYRNADAWGRIGRMLDVEL